MTERLIALLTLAATYFLSAAQLAYAWQLAPRRRTAARQYFLRPRTSQLPAGEQGRLLDFVDAMIGSSSKNDEEDKFRSVEEFDQVLANQIQQALLSAGVESASSTANEKPSMTTADTESSGTKKRIIRPPIQNRAPKTDTMPPHTSLAQVVANQFNIDLSCVTPSIPGAKITAADVEYHAWAMSQPPSTPEALERAHHLGLDLNTLYDDEDRLYVVQLSDVQLYEENSRSLRVASQKRTGILSKDDSTTRQTRKKLSKLDKRMEKGMDLLAKRAKQLTNNVADEIVKRVQLSTTSHIQIAFGDIEKKEINSVQDFDAALAIEIQEALMCVDSGYKDNNGHQNELAEQPQSIDAEADIALETTHASMTELVTQSQSMKDDEADIELETTQTHMSVAEVKGQLRTLGLKVSGNKSQLVKRLYAVKRLQAMKIAELKQELRKQGLKVSGLKAELVKRLLDAQENDDTVAFQGSNQKKADSALFFVDMK